MGHVCSKRVHATLIRKGRHPLYRRLARPLRPPDGRGKRQPGMARVLELELNQNQSALSMPQHHIPIDTLLHSIRRQRIRWKLTKDGIVIRQVKGNVAIVGNKSVARFATNKRAVGAAVRYIRRFTKP